MKANVGAQAGVAAAGPDHPTERKPAGVKPLEPGRGETPVPLGREHRPGALVGRLRKIDLAAVIPDLGVAMAQMRAPGRPAKRFGKPLELDLEPV